MNVDNSGVAVVAAVVVSVMGMITAVLGPFLIAWMGDRRLREIQRVGNLTHQAVNGAMTLQLKISAVALRRVAQLSENVVDLAAADLAEKALLDHETQLAQSNLHKT